MIFNIYCGVSYYQEDLKILLPKQQYCGATFMKFWVQFIADAFM